MSDFFPQHPGSGVSGQKKMSVPSKDGEGKTNKFQKRQEDRQKRKHKRKKGKNYERKKIIYIGIKMGKTEIKL